MQSRKTNVEKFYYYARSLNRYCYTMYIYNQQSITKNKILIIIHAFVEFKLQRIHDTAMNKGCGRLERKKNQKLDNYNSFVYLYTFTSA